MPSVMGRCMRGQGEQLAAARYTLRRHVNVLIPILSRRPMSWGGGGGGGSSVLLALSSDADVNLLALCMHVGAP